MRPLPFVLKSRFMQCAAAMLLTLAGPQYLPAADLPEGFAKGVTGGGAAA
ncbi:pectin lyase, partial [Pseudomonas syringae pv. actinidiae ICMP 18804]